jgi:hypothetical protein
VDLELTTSAPSDGGALPPQVDALATTLLEGAFDVEVEPRRMLVTLETRRNTFFNYDMVTDPDRLVAAVATALDLAILLESAND